MFLGGFWFPNIAKQITFCWYFDLNYSHYHAVKYAGSLTVVKVAT